MRRFVVVLSIVVILVGAVGSAAVADSTATTTPKTLTHVTLPSAGISVGYPATWTAETYKGLSKAAQRKISKLNPNLAHVAEVNAAMKNAKLYAIDATNPGSFASNISIQTTTSGGAPSSLDDFNQYVTSQYVALGATPVDTAAIKVGGRKSYVAKVIVPVKVNDTTTVRAYIEQLLVPNGDGVTLVTVTSTDDDAGHATTEQVISSVKLAH